MYIVSILWTIFSPYILIKSNVFSAVIISSCVYIHDSPSSVMFSISTDLNFILLVCLWPPSLLLILSLHFHLLLWLEEHSPLD